MALKSLQIITLGNFTLPQGVSPIDAVIYLASLASDPKAIEPLLDKLRGITSRISPGSTLSKPDFATIEKVFLGLEDHLVHDEAVRSFSREELHARILNHFALSTISDRLRLKLFLIILITLGCSALSFLVPVAPTEPTPIKFYALLAVPVTFGLLHLGAAWLFIAALQNFQATLRIAYAFLVAAIVVFGLTHLQMLVYGIIDFWDSNWVHEGGLVLTYIPSLLLLYASSIIFSQVIGVTSRLTAWPTVVVAGGALSLLTVLAPHPPTQAPGLEPFFDIAMGGLAFTIVTTFASLVNVVLISRKISALYQPSFRTLAYAIGMILFAILQFLIIRMVWSYHIWYSTYGLIFLPLLLSGILLIWAGYTFSKTSKY